MVFVTIGLGAIAIFQLIGNARQAEHLTKLERPYLFVEPTFELPKAFAMYETANVEAETIKVVFDMVNHGRTPAIIKIIDARLVFLTHPPSRRPTHTHWNENEGVIEGKSREKGIEVSYAKAFTPFDRQGYEKRQASFWFIGAIVYDDMFNTEHVTNFRYRWMPKTQKLVMHGGNQHNKRS
ncbi:MAG: hypothetical protein KF826_14365 [Xanthobacteraceae bacterium]|nr:hypothetical protein [Xanthobacteraceae bacterium]MBX3548221.1 hypothetical protein [Xanthobacteraceae bacterium]MCW5675802.1 hypothetical protein [Xanthobacteraceae bacterium]MCW5679150.1 hypothetical protein [Xanthobacteraceae bacterium]